MLRSASKISQPVGPDKYRGLESSPGDWTLVTFRTVIASARCIFKFYIFWFCYDVFVTLFSIFLYINGYIYTHVPAKSIPKHICLFLYNPTKFSLQISSKFIINKNCWCFSLSVNSSINNINTHLN